MIQEQLHGIKMSNPNVPTKNTGDQFTADECNSIVTSIATKSDQTDVDTLAGIVSGKADQSDLNSLSTVVASKADQSEVDSLSTEVAGKQNVLGFTPENVTNKGQNNGYASLDSTGKVPTAQLPAASAQWGAITGTLSSQKDLQSVIGTTPDKVTGLQVWYDITDLSTIVTDTSNNVSQILDKSGNSKTLTASSNKPVLTFADSENNKPALQIASGHRITITPYVLAVPYTIYMYVKPITYVTTGAILEFDTSFVNGVYMKVAVQTGGHAITLCSGAGYQPTQNAFYKNKWMLIRLTAAADGTVRYSVYDERVEGGDPQYSSLNVGTSSTAKLTIGDTAGSGNAFNIQELMIYNNVPSLKDHNSLVSYFFNKYNPQSGIPYYAHGDSITVGGTSSDNNNTAYAPIVAAANGFDLHNMAISSVDIGYGIAFDNRDLNGIYKSVNYGINRNGYVSFGYATNASTPGPNWAAMYKSIIKSFIDLGFNPRRIIIISPLYNPSSPAVDTAAPYIAQIATDLGILFVDAYTYGLTHSIPDGLLNGQHWTDAGHAAVANLINAVILAG